MKVAVVSERYTGSGAAQAASEVVSSLRSLGHEVSLIVGEEPEAEPEAPTFVAGKWSELYRLLTLAGDNSYSPKQRDSWIVEYHERRRTFAKQFLSLLDEIQPEVVHLHNVSAFLSHATIRSVSQRWPVVWTLHDRAAFDFFHNKWKVWGKTQYSWEKFAGRRPGRSGFDFLTESVAKLDFIAPSRWLADLLNATALGAQHRVHCVPNIVSSPEPSGVFERLNLHSALGVDRLALAVITKSSYSLKGYDVLLEAFFTARALERHPSNRAGSLGLLLTTKEDLGLSEFGIFTLRDLAALDIELEKGYLDQSQMRALYRICDALVIASRAENLPNVALESLRDGCPIVATRVGGIEEIFSNQAIGRLVEPEDVRGMADALVDVLCRHTREDYAVAPQARWSEAYEPALVREQILEVYRGAIASHKGDCE